MIELDKVYQKMFIRAISYCSLCVAGGDCVAKLGTDDTMERHQPAIYTLFCLVSGKKKPFSVQIESNATVDALMTAIKLEKRSECDRFNDLDLFKVDVPVMDLKKLPGQIAALNLPEEMNPLWLVSDYYSASPPVRVLHILVKPLVDGK
jgi:hypothetical protein